MQPDMPLPSTGRLDGRRHLFPVRVYYEDTDFSGLVYHAGYLRYMERGRTEFLRALGLDQMRLLDETGTAFAVRSLSVEFLRPARMDDQLVVETVPVELSGASFRVAQAVRRGEETLVTAEGRAVCLKAGRPTRIPAELRAALAGSSVPLEGQ